MLTLAPLYFAGEIQFGVISQGSMAFRSELQSNRSKCQKN